MTKGLSRSRCDQRGHDPTGHRWIQHEKTIVTFGVVAKEWWAIGRAVAGREGARECGKHVRSSALNARMPGLQLEENEAEGVGTAVSGDTSKKGEAAAGVRGAHGSR